MCTPSDCGCGGHVSEGLDIDSVADGCASYSVAPTVENTVEERPLLAYSSYRGRITHSMWLNLPPIGDGRPGTLHPLVDWTELPDAAREALEAADFGAGDVLCTDRNFRKNLMKSWHGGPQELMDLLIAAEPGRNRR